MFGVRYPGLISWSTPPGGGTTDYAVDIYHKALSDQKYECFLSEETKMPMMYMDDAIDATIRIMQAPAEQIKIRSSYNLAAMSFTPKKKLPPKSKSTFQNLPFHTNLISVKPSPTVGLPASMTVALGKTGIGITSLISKAWRSTRWKI